MITSLFRKSTPLNYALIIISVTVFFFLYQIGHGEPANSLIGFGKMIGLLTVIFGSLFTANFIVKKNGLSKDSSYTILFYLMFVLFFPGILNKPNLLLSNFFVLLALRRLMSLHSLKAAKEKVFDASLWIFVAALFHFWSIIFILLVFISILFHVARDYRSWVLPFLAFFVVAAVFGLVALFFDESLIQFVLDKTETNFSINYFTSNKQNVALSFYASIALFFVASMLITLSSRPLVLQASYKKIIVAFLIGAAIFVVSSDKSNETLLFTIAPLSFMATSHIEWPQEILKREIKLAIVILSGLFLFFYQL